MQQKRKIEAIGLKNINEKEYKFYDNTLWFFQGESITSNTEEEFKIISVGHYDKSGDYYIIESLNKITPKNLKRIDTFQLST